MNERMKIILKIITKNFLENGTAMGSPTIARKKEINFSAATVRNIMCELEEAKNQEKEFVIERTEELEQELIFQLKRLSDYSDGVSFAVYKNKFIVQGNPVRMISKVINLKREVLDFFSDEAKIEKICRDFLQRKEEFLYADKCFKPLKDFGISGITSESKGVAVGTILLKNGDYKKANKAARKILGWLESKEML